MIVGIDFSLTATGVCSLTDGEAECVTITSRKEHEWWEFPRRVEGIALDIEAWLGREHEPTLVIETPAFAAKSSSLDRMFGGWWLLVETLMTACLYAPPILVTPGQLKKFATGNGNAPKDAVMLAVARSYPEVNVTDNNQTDALTLAAIGAAVMGEPFTKTLTKAQEKIVADIRGKKEN